MKKNTQIANRFNYDFIEKKIVGTKASFDKASKGFGPIYEELAAKMAAHPDFEIKIVAPKSNKERQVYHGMDIDFMRDYLVATNSDYVAQFDKIITFAENNKKSKYPLAKKYFLKQYTDKDGNVTFNYEDAKMIVENYRIGKVA